MRVEEQINHLICTAVASLYNATIEASLVQVQPTRKEFEGEFTVVVFSLTKFSKLSPEQTAEQLGAFLKTEFTALENFSVVKGFLNLKLTSTFWTSSLQAGLAEANFGALPQGSKGMVMVEFASPNTNKPLHLGHLRNIFLGDSVSRILQACGHRVERVQIVNDRGIHICKSMVAWHTYGMGETPTSTGLKGDHLVGKYYVKFNDVYKAQVAELMAGGLSSEVAKEQAPILLEARDMLLKWEAKDVEIFSLWEKMNGWVYDGFEQSYRRMGVSFDEIYHESNTYSIGKEIALDGLVEGPFYKKEDGSVWIDLTDQGLDEKLILRKDGTAVYITQDIGTAILRYRDFPEITKMVYTVGNEQEYHFKVLFLILEKLGFSWARDCHHLSYGMVELPEGKMKSREGTVVEADEIMQEMVDSAKALTTELGKLEGLKNSEKEVLYEDIGLAALKYFLLKVDPKKNMLFNPVESIDFNGHTGPFIQYSYARIQSVLRNYGPLPTTFSLPDELSKVERSLEFKIHQYPDILAQCALEYNPAYLANFIYELAKDFASFYQNYSILHAESETLKSYRAGLAAMVGRIIKGGMALLGISVPEQM